MFVRDRVLVFVNLYFVESRSQNHMQEQRKGIGYAKL